MDHLLGQEERVSSSLEKTGTISTDHLLGNCPHCSVIWLNELYLLGCNPESQTNHHVFPYPNRDVFPYPNRDAYPLASAWMAS